MSEDTAIEYSNIPIDNSLIPGTGRSISILKWTYPNNLYESNRNKTNMSIFRNPLSYTGKVEGNTVSSGTVLFDILVPEMNRNY